MTARNNIENQNPDLRNRFSVGKQFYDLGGEPDGGGERRGMTGTESAGGEKRKDPTMRSGVCLNEPPPFPRWNIYPRQPLEETGGRDQRGDEGRKQISEEGGEEKKEKGTETKRKRMNT